MAETLSRTTPDQRAIWAVPWDDDRTLPATTVGGFLLATAAPGSAMTHVASAAQERFPSPFSGIPDHSIKVLVNGARVTKEQLGEGGQGFAFEGPEHELEIVWGGIPFEGVERVSFHASPVNCGPIHLRLPSICVWDSLSTARVAVTFRWGCSVPPRGPSRIRGRTAPVLQVSLVKTPPGLRPSVRTASRGSSGR